jgi:hypothetical protein
VPDLYSVQTPMYEKRGCIRTLTTVRCRVPHECILDDAVVDEARTSVWAADCPVFLNQTLRRIVLHWAFNVLLSFRSAYTSTESAIRKMANSSASMSRMYTLAANTSSLLYVHALILLCATCKQHDVQCCLQVSRS